MQPVGDSSRKLLPGRNPKYEWGNHYVSIIGTDQDQKKCQDF